MTKIISETILILIFLHKGNVVSPKRDLQAFINIIELNSIILIKA